MADEFKQRFLAERARALATVILTRRDDLLVTETKNGTGLDYHIYVNREGRPVRAMFGVLLRAVFSPTTPAHANQVLGSTMADFRRMGRFTYPVCLFFFTMRDDQGFFAWLAEPVLSEEGTPKLLHHKHADCRELDNLVINDAVNRVVAWYDALEAELVAE